MIIAFLKWALLVLVFYGMLELGYIVYVEWRKKR